MPFSFPAIILPNAVSNTEVSATAAITESKLLFANSGGHTHTGADATGTKVLWSSINKSTSSIADITTKSHTALSDIGTNTHAQIDTQIATTIPATYAPIAKGVTNGDSHDHSGGDGAQVNHTTLSNIGTNTHAQIDTHLGAASPHSAHLRRNRVTWTGNNTVNRAIAHGLTAVYFILVSTSLNSVALILQKDDDNTWRWDRSGGSQQAVTAPDGTNFYVGNATSYGESANDSSYSYAAEIIGV